MRVRVGALAMGAIAMRLAKERGILLSYEQELDVIKNAGDGKTGQQINAVLNNAWTREEDQ